MKSIAFVTQKGGSGKTTLVINCAVAAHQKGYKTLILDMDPQQTAEKWYQKREQDAPHLISVRPSEINKAMQVAEDKCYDIVLVDTPGHDSPGTADAVRASHYCIVPCRPTPGDMEATPATFNTIKQLVKPLAFVLTQTMPRRKRTIGFKKEPHPRSKEAAAGLGRLALVAPVHITALTAFPDAQGLGLGVTEYEPDGTAAEEIENLWAWLSHKLKEITHGQDNEEKNIA